jgi:tetratricopeptide (TPR) repeat protein
MKNKRWLTGASCAVLLLLPLLAGADALLKPVPVPDTSKLPADQVKRLADDRKEFDKARAELVGPPLAQAYADIGVIYARAGFKDAAAIALYDATQANPQDGRWFYLRGLLAREQKQNAEARANFEAALAVDKIYLPIRYRLSDTLIDLGDVDAARKVLEAATREHPDQAAAHAMLGQLELRQKRYTQAIENINRALALEPQANQLYKPLAEAYAGVSNTQAAKDAEAKAGNVAPTLADPLAFGLSGGAPAAATAQAPLPKVSGTALQQAQQLAKAGRVGPARSKLAEVLSATPNDVEALALQARLEGSVGNLVIAAAAADQALSVAPDSGAALLSRGVVYEYAGDDNHAYDFYQRAVRADSRQSLARLLLGNAEMRRARYPQAVEQYRAAVALQPDDMQAHARLAAAEVASGQCAKALSDTSAAQERNPKDGDLMQVFVRLASTCAGAKKEERDMALDYAQALYKQRPESGESSALALALAAHGKFKDAQQYQAEAIFEAIRGGDKAGADQLKATQADFVAQKVPDRPWPAEHVYFKPPLLTPQRLAAASAAPGPAPTKP